MDVKYTYSIFDWKTRQTIIERLPLQGVSFSDALEGGGSLSGDLRLEKNADLILDATLPARRLLLVERNKRVAWGGLIWTRSWSSSSKKLSIGAGTIDTYFGRRVVRDTLVWSGKDQLTIANDLINYAQTQATAGGVGDMGVLLLTPGVSGVNPELTLLPQDGKTVLEVIKSLGGGDNGFDYHFDVDKTADGTPQFTFRTGWPYLGQSYTNVAMISLEYPGVVLSYDIPEDATETSTWVRGIGSSASNAIADVDNTSMYTNGWPALESVTNYSEIDDSTILSDFVQDDARRLGDIVGVPNIVIRGDRDPQFGDYHLGDWVELHVKDLRHPQGAIYLVRIIGISVRPAANDQAEEITLTVDTARPT